MSDLPRALPDDEGAADDALADRLHAALATSLQAPVPADLVGVTMAAVRAERQARSVHPLLVLGGIAAAVAIAVGIGASIGRPPSPGPTGQPAATVAVEQPTAVTATPALTPAASPALSPAATAPASSQATPPPGEPAFPAAVDGLPVLAVSEALAARDDPASAGAPLRAAIRGWLAVSPPLPCPAPVPVSPLVGSCPDSFDALMERREQLWVSNGWHEPAKDNPSLNPRFLSVERNFDPRLATFLAAPLPVVLVGHFHDGRAALCGGSLRAACLQAFVVERVAWIDGTATATAPPGPAVIDCPIKDCTAIVTALRASIQDQLGTAQRVVIATGCPPWVFCTFQPAVRVLVVPQGWRGIAADVGVYEFGGSAGAAAVTPVHPSLDDWSLARAGGYTVHCPAPSAGMYAPDCYRIAVGAATAALLQSNVPIASITVQGKCGGYDLVRTDGTAVGLRPSCTLTKPSASPAPDARLTCRSSPCLAVAAAVERADPDAYAAAARVAFVPGCAPWMRCPPPAIVSGLDTVVLVPAGWEGDTAGLRAWRVSGPRSGALVATPVPPIGAYQLTVVGGYPVTCAGGMFGATCYERAAAAAADEWQRGHVAIAGVTVSGPCGDVEVLRADGTLLTTQSVCMAPSPIASPSTGP